MYFEKKAWAHLAHPVLLVLLVQLDHPAHLVHLGLKDPKDHQDLVDHLVHRAKMACLDNQAGLELTLKMVWSPLFRKKLLELSTTFEF